jgi:hypothetical protein
LALLRVVSLWGSTSHLGAYYFQHRGKPVIAYIAPLSPDKLDHWRDDWVIVQTKVHDRLALSTSDPMGRRSH